MTHVTSDGGAPTTIGDHYQRYGIVGRSRGIDDVIQRIELVSATRSTVLITGETGTGKELVARAVHICSAQRRPAVHQGQLCGHPGDAAGIGALRPRQRSVHRRHRSEEGQVLAGESRIHLSRRDRHDERRPPGQAVAGPAGTRNRAARRGADGARGRSRDRGDQPRPAPARRGGTVSGRPVLSPARRPDRRCRRFANGSKTFRCWWSTSWRSTRRGPARRSMRWRRA